MPSIKRPSTVILQYVIITKLAFHSAIRMTWAFICYERPFQILYLLLTLGNAESWKFKKKIISHNLYFFPFSVTVSLLVNTIILTDQFYYWQIIWRNKKKSYCYRWERRNGLVIQNRWESLAGLVDLLEISIILKINRTFSI